MIKQRYVKRGLLPPSLFPSSRHIDKSATSAATRWLQRSIALILYIFQWKTARNRLTVGKKPKEGRQTLRATTRRVKKTESNRRHTNFEKWKMVQNWTDDITDQMYPNFCCEHYDEGSLRIQRRMEVSRQ